MRVMKRIVTLLLVLATFVGTLSVPNVGFASGGDLVVVQTMAADAMDDDCEACPTSNEADSTPCLETCPVSCTGVAPIMFVTQVSLALNTLTAGARIARFEPDTLQGVVTAVIPAPPKLSV